MKYTKCNYTVFFALNFPLRMQKVQFKTLFEKIYFLLSNTSWSLMIQAQKYTSLAFAYYDGIRATDKLTEIQKIQVVRSVYIYVLLFTTKNDRRR
jgi:hypothetical protein